MFNQNAFKTSMIFLGMIFLGIILRTFLIGDSLFVKTESKNETANITCVFEKFC